jgi:hypothetical protein
MPGRANANSNNGIIEEHKRRILFAPFVKFVKKGAFGLYRGCHCTSSLGLEGTMAESSR